ncbi:toll-like receptor 2 [Xenopus tropicalis]|uniref:Monocyte differentiation antigen CD14 n=1 Tax=Xenopus tropicalis TaxID=8364 RepID=A0A8J1JAE1_XENTR|nr:toll-like receptor 2 [Xenopus tropicalis]
MLWANGGCYYNKDLRHCSCSLVDLTNVMSIVSCIQASSLEFQGGRFVDTEEYSLHNVEMEQVLAMIHLPLSKVVFANVVISEEFLLSFLNWVQRIQINVLAFVNTTFEGRSKKQQMSGSPPQILSLQVINVPSYPLLDRVSTFSGLSSWIYNLEDLTLTKSHLTGIPCNTSRQFKILSSLDLSENLLQDENISSSFCQGAFPNIKTLKLNHNRLVSFDTICQTLNKQNQLKHLDLSQNNLSSTSTSLCEWQPSLALLNLSDTGLEELPNILPRNCEILDLSYNKLDALNLSLPSLKELYLSHNLLTTISTVENFPCLQTLAINGNPIKTLQRGQLQYFRHISSIRADNIPYTCSCSLVHEMNEMTMSSLTFQHWPDGYICASPDLLKGQRVSEVKLSFFECHKPLLTVLICIVSLLVLVAAVICIHKFHQSKKTRLQNVQRVNVCSMQFHT